MQGRGKLDDTLAAMFSNIEYRDSYLFYAHIIGQCSIKIDEELPAPAGVAFVTDHYNLYVNPIEFDKFTLKERLSILKHEALHILYGHIGERSKGLNPMGWNLGTDCALNQHIDSTHLPACAITPKTVEAQLNIKVPIDQSAEFYYNLFKKEAKERQSKEGSQGQGDASQSNGNGNGFPQSMDTHKTWEESVGDGELQEDMTKKMVERAQTETIKGKGTIPSACSTWIELHSRKSEVNWKKVLRGIIGHKRVGTRTTIMRPDRRFPTREDLRGKTKDRMFNLLVIADVSGSMSQKAITSTLSEVRHICDVTKTDVDLIQVDTVAYEPEKLSKKTVSITRKGSGGTYLFPAIQKAKDKKIDFQAIVILTDGGLLNDDIHKFRELNKKIIWLVKSGGKVSDFMNAGRMQAFRLKEA